MIVVLSLLVFALIWICVWGFGALHVRLSKLEGLEHDVDLLFGDVEDLSGELETLQDSVHDVQNQVDDIDSDLDNLYIRPLACVWVKEHVEAGTLVDLGCSAEDILNGVLVLSGATLACKNYSSDGAGDYEVVEGGRVRFSMRLRANDVIQVFVVDFKPVEDDDGDAESDDQEVTDGILHADGVNHVMHVHLEDDNTYTAYVPGSDTFAGAMGKGATVLDACIALGKAVSDVSKPETPPDEPKTEQAA